MADSVFIIWSGGFSSPNADIMNRLKKPRGPSSALKPAATTTVGKIKGRLVNIPHSRFARKRYRAKTYAAGKPTNRVKPVDNVACQIVNHNDLPILSHASL